jgi:hypothetical protein
LLSISHHSLQKVVVVVYICLSFWSCFLFIFFMIWSLVFEDKLTLSVCCLLSFFFLWSLFAWQEFVPTLDSEQPLDTSHAKVAEKEADHYCLWHCCSFYLSWADTFLCECLGNADFLFFPLGLFFYLSLGLRILF